MHHKLTHPQPLQKYVLHQMMKGHLQQAPGFRISIVIVTPEMQDGYIAEVSDS
jgi:hypothetical protein